MSVSVSTRTYMGIAVTILVALAIYSLYKVWEYLLTPGSSNPSFFQFHMGVTVGAAFAMAALLIAYHSYVVSKESARIR